MLGAASRTPSSRNTYIRASPAGAATENAPSRSAAGMAATIHPRRLLGLPKRIANATGSPRRRGRQRTTDRHRTVGQALQRGRKRLEVGDGRFLEPRAGGRFSRPPQSLSITASDRRACAAPAALGFRRGQSRVAHLGPERMQALLRAADATVISSVNAVERRPSSRSWPWSASWRKCQRPATVMTDQSAPEDEGQPPRAPRRGRVARQRLEDLGGAMQQSRA